MFSTHQQIQNHFETNVHARNEYLFRQTIFITTDRVEYEVDMQINKKHFLHKSLFIMKMKNMQVHFLNVTFCYFNGAIDMLLWTVKHNNNYDCNYVLYT